MRYYRYLSEVTAPVDAMRNAMLLIATLLVLVTGAGAEARNSIGLVLVGGMAIGTIFTLFVVPAMYQYIGRDYGNADKKAAAVTGGET